MIKFLFPNIKNQILSKKSIDLKNSAKANSPATIKIMVSNIFY